MTTFPDAILDIAKEFGTPHIEIYGLPCAWWGSVDGRARLTLFGDYAHVWVEAICGDASLVRELAGAEPVEYVSTADAIVHARAWFTERGTPLAMPTEGM